MAGIAAIVGIASSLASAAVGMAGAAAQAKYIKAQAQAEQQQLGMQAAEERAVGTRRAQDKVREGSLLLSRQQAVAAASGAGATDPTVLELAGTLKRDTNVQSREFARQGLEKAQMLEYQGRVGNELAKAQAGMTILGGIGNTISAVGEAIGGFGDAYAKYGRGMPTSASLGASSPASWYNGYN
jgi:hypothetical protein